jgi:hypothetical protein
MSVTGGTDVRHCVAEKHFCGNVPLSEHSGMQSSEAVPREPGHGDSGQLGIHGGTAVDKKPDRMLQA